MTNPGSNNVIKLRASDGAILGTYTIYAGSICFDGTYIWVTNTGNSDTTNGNVIKVKASDGSVLGNYMVGIGPDGICFDGTNIWVANVISNTVTKLTITK